MSGRFERAFFFAFLQKGGVNFYNNSNSTDKIKKPELFYKNRRKTEIWIN